MSETDTRKRGEATKAALLCALFIPGSGQLYNRHYTRGAIMMVVFTAASLAVLVPVAYSIALYFIHLGNANPEQAALALNYLYDNGLNLAFLTLVSIGLYIYSIVDAYYQSPYK